MEQVEVSIIIVTYNTADLIEACLSSLYGEKGPAREVFVVDNASTDGGAELLRERFPEVKLIENKENRGFAAANNQVLPFCRGRYVFYLNPDTKLVSSEVIGKCVRFMDAKPEIGLAGVKLVNPDGSLQESVSFRYPGERFSKSEVAGLDGEIACVMGAGMITKTELIRRIGGFDEDFVLYGEDQDLCLRIRRAGYQIGFIEDAVVLHYGGWSGRRSLSADVWRKKTIAEYLFYQKHYKPKTIERIRRNDLLKARFRLFTLALIMPFAVDRTGAEGKRIKYRTIYETVKHLEI